MDLSNIEIGKTYKNYKELCEVLGEPIKNGNSKKAQLKKWKECFEWEQDGHKFIIKKIKSTFKTIQESELVDLYCTDLQKNNYTNTGKVDGNTRKTILREAGRYYDIEYNKSTKEYEIYNTYKYPVSEKTDKKYINSKEYICMDIEDMKKCGVYKIEDNNKNVYIGSTKKNFYYRFKEHHRGNDKRMLYTKELIDNGGKMYSLWVAEEETSEQEIRDKEREYILKYLNNPEYNVLNHRDRLPNTGIRKIKKRIIKVSEYDYDKVMELLTKENINMYNN